MTGQISAALRRLIIDDEHGQDLIEYGLLAAFIAIVAFGSVQAVGASLGDLWNTIDGETSSAAASS